MSELDQALSIYVDPTEGRFINYAVSTKGRKSTVRIDIEMTEPWALGRLIGELQRMKERQLGKPARSGRRASTTSDGGEG